MKSSLKDIAVNGLIAAVYVVLTLLTYPFSFMGIQFRVAEILVLLCFFRKDYICGLTIGCAIANLFSSIGIADVLFGTLATLISCLVIIFSKHLLFACFISVVINGLVIGVELYIILGQQLWLSCAFVALGEVLVMAIGYGLFMSFKTRKNFYRLIRAKQNIDFKF